MSLPFWAFSALYPLNLYIFEFISTHASPANFDPIKTKTASTIVSCSILLTFVNFFRFDFSLNVETLRWTLIALAPFVIPWLNAEAEEKLKSFLFWRNFVIAPACEEFYYRILLPRLCNSIPVLSVSFSLAHAHPLLFPKNWSSAKLQAVLAQCGQSFCFGVICGKLKVNANAPGHNFWIFLALTLLHGVANYCGVPLLNGKNRAKYIQAAILLVSMYLILK